MAEKAGADVYPVDIGVACELGETGTVHPPVSYTHLDSVSA